MPFDQDALRDAGVFDGWFHDGDGVVFDVVEDSDATEMVLFDGFVNGLLEVGVEAEDLGV